MTHSIQVPVSSNVIGLCADIHASYDHVLAMRQPRPDVEHWFCAGDVVDMHEALHYNQPALRVLSRLDIPSVMENHDYRYKERHLHRLDEEARKYMDQMPFRLDFQFAGNKIRIYHATPESRESFALERAGEETFFALFDEDGAGILGEVDVVVLGHTHNPYVRDIGGTRFVNPGALGLPEEEPPRSACLAGTGRPRLCIWTKRHPRHEKRLPTSPKPTAVSKFLSW